MAVERIRRRRPVRQRIIEVGRKKVVKVRSRGLFVLPNLFTTASLFCAFISIVQAMEQNFGLAALMIMLSMLFDGMDGRVARLTHTQSEFGVQFDSIADMTAFGSYLPTVLTFSVSMRPKRWILSSPGMRTAGRSGFLDMEYLLRGKVFFLNTHPVCMKIVLL